MSSSVPKEILIGFWRFVRRDMTPQEFEQWVYAQTTLEDVIGSALYFDVISTDYRNADTVYRIRSVIEGYARSVTELRCDCITLANLAVVDMASPGDALEHFKELRRRGDPYWWLGLSKCTVCGTPWLVAQEERQNDVFVLRRLTETQCGRILTENAWPSDFDRYDTLLRIGRDAGHSVSFLDPVGDSSLSWTMRDLAHERPGIRLTEIAQLLNLDIQTATVIAESVIAQGADITVDV